MDTEAKVFSLLSNELIRHDANTFYWFGIELSKELAIAYWSKRYVGFYMNGKFLKTLDPKLNSKFTKLDRKLDFGDDPYADDRTRMFKIIMFETE